MPFQNAALKRALRFPPTDGPAMRAPMVARGAALTLLLVATLPAARDGAADAATVRVFAVGHKQRLDDAVSVASFREKMFALVDAARRGPGMLVQPGADDVASHLAPDDPGAPALAVVHFPEDTGLVAGLIGSRGRAARG